jgi:P pilus assembly chaperone PapD
MPLRSSAFTPHLSALTWLLSFWLSLLLPGLALANNVPIAVAPVSVRLDVATDIAGVQVSNRGEAPSGVEIEIMRVRWLNGVEEYEGSQDFVISPPSFRLLAGKARMVRFKYNGTRQDTEGFYRLFIRQLPSEQTNNQINMVFNIGVPVFIAPLKSTPSLQVSATADELRNTGNVTLTVMSLEGQGCASPVPVTARISPGQKIALTAAQARCAKTAQTDKGSIALSTP